MNIVLIEKNSQYIENVIELGKKNANTLGFLPQGAYLTSAAKKQILIAITDDKKIGGYLLYGINRRSNLIYIVHLCVDINFRKQGIARKLFQRLCEMTKEQLYGVRVRCRSDYEANSIWPKLGFREVNRRPGRSKKGSTLIVWWFDHGHPNLFSVSEDTSSNIEAVIDANIFFELREGNVSSKNEVVALSNDWLQETVEFCLTPEIFNEISRDQDTARKKKTTEFTRNFLKIAGDKSKFQEVENQLKPYFPDKLTISDKSDIKQLAWTIAAGIPFFITTDESLISKREKIFVNFSTRIFRPSDFIIHLDYSSREVEYQPARLAGSQIKRVKVSSTLTPALDDTFRADQEETKGAFKNLVLPLLSNPRVFDVQTIYENENLLVLIAYGRKDIQTLEIPVLRFSRSPLAGTLARFLLLESLLIASKDNLLYINVTDPYCSLQTISALKELGFIYSNKKWVKLNLFEVTTSDKLENRIETLSKQILGEFYIKNINDKLKLATTTNNKLGLLDVERSLWPAKISDLDVPCFIVPIQPWFAMQLFDEKLAKQDLFGAQDPNLALRVENVYYRSSHTKVLSAPSRVLWYVSKGKSNYSGSMAIRASSYIDEVIIDKPKPLYLRFKRLGIFTWDNIKEMVKDDLEKDIMAFSFSQTEVFKYPIEYSQLGQMWKKQKNRNFNIQSPLQITSEAFIQIYQLGLGQ